MPQPEQERSTDESEESPGALAARLLPWASADGKPCYLSTDGHGYVARVADRLEAMQLAMAREVLDCAGSLIARPAATAVELRFAAVRLSECLRDALRIAESRGGRLGARPRE
ncbi:MULTISPECIES: hypothetical protein [unclassified Streptomyces]|uniref:hypothetical protein n=1 Tax=unclassified Streptomyces TaxID=2593676 RepID=UPI0035DB7ED1